MDKRVDREDKSLLIGKRNKDVFSLELMTWVPTFKDLATWPTESSLCTGALQGYMLLTTQSFPFKVVETEKFINDKFPTSGQTFGEKIPHRWNTVIMWLSPRAGKIVRDFSRWSHKKKFFLGACKKYFIYQA